MPTPSTQNANPVSHKTAGIRDLFTFCVLSCWSFASFEEWAVILEVTALQGLDPSITIEGSLDTESAPKLPNRWHMARPGKPRVELGVLRRGGHKGPSWS